MCTQVEDGYYETRCTSTRLQVETTPSPAQPQVQEVVTTTQVQDQGQVQPDTTGCQYRWDTWVYLQYLPNNIYIIYNIYNTYNIYNI